MRRLFQLLQRARLRRQGSVLMFHHLLLWSIHLLDQQLNRRRHLLYTSHLLYTRLLQPSSRRLHLRTLRSGKFHATCLSGRAPGTSGHLRGWAMARRSLCWSSCQGKRLRQDGA